ncbi:GNAT family N-acetyltransferase [Luteimonas sp. R10]|uniref:GNAT family N-acetyltransferase n=1 Tax=Luteimonas sp. R10 TaxID=3108176 RepID=UPI00309117B3|nr:GNAT family N-acetyltransferase [Luteimonas sp. R10]
MADAGAAPAIHHDSRRGLFEVEVEGHRAQLAYGLQDGIMTILSTLVPAAVGGRGIAGRLVDAALQHARAQGLRVDPRCSYAAAYIDRHPEHAGLRA